jgi:hypothetical protein
MISCLKCEQQQWSEFDKDYLRLFGNCWSCDKKKWQAKEMTLEEFELRENQAAKS